MDNGKRSQGHVSGSFCRRKGRRVAAKITAKRTASHASISVLTVGSSLKSFGAGDVRCTPDGKHAVIKIFCNFSFEMCFYTIQFHRRQEFSVWKLRKTQIFSAHADVFFDVIIPWRNIFITHRPIDGDAILFIGFKIDVAQTVALASPHDGSATYVIASHPIKTLHFVVGMFGVVYEEVSMGFIGGVTGSVLFFVIFQFFLRDLTVGFKIPWILVHGWIIFDVANHATSFKDQSFQTLFAEFFCGPSTADTRTYDDGIILGLFRNVIKHT